jgi:hypothetical protein
VVVAMAAEKAHRVILVWHSIFCASRAANDQRRHLERPGVVMGSAILSYPSDPMTRCCIH